MAATSRVVSYPCRFGPDSSPGNTVLEPGAESDTPQPSPGRRRDHGSPACADYHDPRARYPHYSRERCPAQSVGAVVAGSADFLSHAYRGMADHDCRITRVLLRSVSGACRSVAAVATHPACRTRGVIDRSARSRGTGIPAPPHHRPSLGADRDGLFSTFDAGA